MSYSAKLKGVVSDAMLNKNVGSVSFWVHRISGIGLSVYLLMHTYVLSAAISGPESFSGRMKTVQNPFFAVLEVLLIAGVFLHMLNGVRITVTDFFGWSKAHKAFFWVVIVLFIILMILALILQWPKFSPQNYGMGGI